MPQYLILLAIVLLGFTGVFSQKVVVTRDEVSAAYSLAVEKARELPRVHNSKSSSMMDGGSYSLQWTWEHANPYRYRMVFEEEKNEGFLRVEMINSEEKTFCKINDGAWTQTAGTCSVRAPWMVTQMSRMMNTNASSEFSMEIVEMNGQKLRKYAEVARLAKRMTTSGKEIPPSSYESIFWVDSMGRITRQEYKSTSSESKRSTSTWVDTYVYVSSLTFDVPRTVQ